VSSRRLPDIIGSRLGGAQSGGPLMQEPLNAVYGEVAIIQDCGHWLADESPDEVLRYLAK